MPRKADTPQLNVRLEADMLADLKALSVVSGESMNALALEALQEYLWARPEAIEAGKRIMSGWSAYKNATKASKDPTGLLLAQIRGGGTATAPADASENKTAADAAAQAPVPAMQDAQDSEPADMQESADTADAAEAGDSSQDVQDGSSMAEQLGQDATTGQGLPAQGSVLASLRRMVEEDRAQGSRAKNDPRYSQALEIFLETGSIGAVREQMQIPQSTVSTWKRRFEWDRLKGRYEREKNRNR